MTTAADITAEVGEAFEEGIKFDKQWLIKNQIRFDITTLKYVDPTNDEGSGFWVVGAKLLDVPESAEASVGYFFMSDRPYNMKWFGEAKRRLPIVNNVLREERQGKATVHVIVSA